MSGAPDGLDASVREAQRRLESSTSAKAEMGDADDSGIAMRDVLRRLLRGWPRAATGDDRRDLHALCRLVHLRPPVRRCYRPGWSADDDAPEIDPAESDALTTALLAWAASPRSTGLDRGLRLKCLNAVYRWLDRRDETITEGATLRARAEASLDAVLAEGDP